MQACFLLRFPLLNFESLILEFSLFVELILGETAVLEFLYPESVVT